MQYINNPATEGWLHPSLLASFISSHEAELKQRSATPCVRLHQAQLNAVQAFQWSKVWRDSKAALSSSSACTPERVATASVSTSTETGGENQEIAQILLHLATTSSHAASPDASLRSSSLMDDENDELVVQPSSPLQFTLE